MSIRLYTLAVAAALSLAAGQADAQIRIGQTSSFTGPVAASVKEGTDGARLYINAVNARGGVNGQRIELVSLDDKFDPKLAAANAKTLIVEQAVVALFFNRGTPQTEAIMPLLNEYKVPLIAPSTGAMSLHEPVHPWLFNVRSTYQREAERAVQHLSLVGIERIALLQADDSFGNDGAKGALRGFDLVAKKPVLHEKYSRTKPEFGPIAPKVVAAQAQAVIIVGSGTHVSDAVRALRAAGSKAQMVTLSNNAAAGFIKSLGEHAHGTIISQVFPYERSMATALVREVTEAAKAGGVLEVTPGTLEGYASAKVLVEALRRAGRDPTRERVRAALETFRRFDIGGFEVSYSPTDHTGLEYADLSIVGADGVPRR
jgi:ABC-type branched-subunit amino acid transport system substrate-binding protein